MTQCAQCGSTFDAFVSFGPMPLANGFLSEDAFSSERYCDLGAGFCPHCTLVQLMDPLPPASMFHDDYPFFTSSSAHMKAHFRRLAQGIIRELYGNQDAFVVEIGSNDGTMLQPIAGSGIRHLGVEPSRNVAEAARANGVDTLSRFFDAQVSRDIVNLHGQADVVLASNCFCHIPDLHSLGDGIRSLLKPSGKLIFEDPYLGDIVRLTAYDQIYDEHVYYFSLSAVTAWLGRHGLDVIDAQPQAVHGGSMRYTAAHRKMHNMHPRVDSLRLQEKLGGLANPETFGHFRHRIERSRDALVELLTSLRRDGRRVAGYGATSKSTTVLNYCRINTGLIEFITDTTPLKQGKFTPGAHVPVRPHSDFHADYPDFALLFAWNHEAEILAKEDRFRDSGGKWIKYVPRVSIV